MSERRPQRISWQYVALAAIGAAFFLGVYVVIPADQAQSRTALLGVLILAGQAAVSHFLSHRVDKVDHKVNGRMTQMINALERAHATIAKLERDQGSDVSRETEATTTNPRPGRRPAKTARTGKREANS